MLIASASARDPSEYLYSPQDKRPDHAQRQGDRDDDSPGYHSEGNPDISPRHRPQKAGQAVVDDVSKGASYGASLARRETAGTDTGYLGLVIKNYTKHFSANRHLEEYRAKIGGSMLAVPGGVGLPDYRGYKVVHKVLY